MTKMTSAPVNEVLADTFASAVTRARADFLEMPGLQLTEAQAARLWCFDSELCGRVLDTLVESRFLMRTRNSFRMAA